MKKKILFIFSLLLSVLFINTVNAKEPYYLEWNIEEKNETYSSQLLEYNDGYLAIDRTETGTILKTFSETGELIKTKKLSYTYVENAVADNKNIYLYLYDDDEGYFFIRMYDENLTLKGEYVTYGEPFMSIGMTHELAGLRIKNDYLYAIELTCDYSCTATVEQIELDLSDGKVVEDLNEIKGLSPILEEEKVWDMLEEGEFSVSYFLPDYDLDDWINPDYKDGKFLFGLWIIKDGDVCDEEGWIYGECYTTNIVVLEKGKELLNIELEKEQRGLQQVKFIDDNIAVVTRDYDEGNVYVNIYNQEGELLQSIEYEGDNLSINETSKGFAVSRGSYTRAKQIDFSSPKQSQHENQLNSPFAIDESRPAEKTVYEVYYRYFKANTNITGKGNIVLDKDYKAGEEVTLNIIPEEGYTLGEIKVTDSKGNTIKVTDNKLTMPADDINIEVTFNEIKENPNTADIITTIAIIAVIASGLLIYSNKRTKEMK